MNIIGAENLDEDALALKLRNGYRLVSYQFCISIIILTFKRSSSVYLVPPGDSDIGNRMLFAAISFFFGWWGFPFGPIFTTMALFNVFQGGTDHSLDFMRALVEQADREQVVPERVDTLRLGTPAANAAAPGTAVAAIALGLAGLMGLGPLASIPAIICGHLALNQMKRTGNNSGKGLAVAGLALGYLLTLLAIVVVAVLVAVAMNGG